MSGSSCACLRRKRARQRPIRRGTWHGHREYLTFTGQLDYNGSLTKFLTGAVRRRNIYVAKTKLRIGPMVSFDSKTDDIVGGLLLKKHTAIGNNFDLWLKIAASAEVNTCTKQVRCQP